MHPIIVEHYLRLALPLAGLPLLFQASYARILVTPVFLLVLLLSQLRPATFALLHLRVLERLRGQLDTLNEDFVPVSVKFNEWVSTLDPDALHSLTEILKLEVSSCIGALKLLIVILKVDALVIVEINHLRLALSLLLRP